MCTRNVAFHQEPADIRERSLLTAGREEGGGGGGGEDFLIPYFCAFYFDKVGEIFLHRGQDFPQVFRSG